MDESDAEREVDAALDEEEKRRKQADILIEIGRTAELFRTSCGQQVSRCSRLKLRPMGALSW